MVVARCLQVMLTGYVHLAEPSALQTRWDTSTLALPVGRGVFVSSRN